VPVAVHQLVETDVEVGSHGGPADGPANGEQNTAQPGDDEGAVCGSSARLRTNPVAVAAADQLVGATTPFQPTVAQVLVAGATLASLPLR